MCGQPVSHTETGRPVHTPRAPALAGQGCLLRPSQYWCPGLGTFVQGSHQLHSGHRQPWAGASTLGVGKRRHVVTELCRTLGPSTRRNGRLQGDTGIPVEVPAGRAEPSSWH